ncbi:MAG: translation initiation factor IF-2 [Clostridiaceae bacterium]|nr:translation initiation factor IF-2 [Clostridiaceae bacterium]
MTIRRTGVAFLNKPKIHELAKELNVTSKRLMEKLNEINIFPKSHMTTLEDDELERLFKHIGVVQRSKDDADSSPSDADVKHDLPEAKKSAPRIIRKTEVIFHDDPLDQEQKDKKERKTIVRASDSNDGLMAGFTRKKDSAVISVRKRAKPEKEKPAEEIKPAVKISTEQFSGVNPQPDSDILSIKKVTKRPKIENEVVKSTSAKEQENMQRDTIFNETEIQAIKKVEKVAKKPVEIADKEQAGKEKTSEKVPETETVYVKEVQAGKQKEADEEKSVPAETKDANQPSTRQEVEALNKAEAAETREEKQEEKTGLQDMPKTPEQKQQEGESKLRDKAQRDSVTQGQRRAGASPVSRPAFDKDAKPADVRNDGSKGTSGKNKLLAIPKAVTPSGLIEEKVLTRGERRSFQGVERQKEEKKELKRDQARINVGNINKNKKYKKKLDTVIGHKARVTDMMSDDFVIDEFYDDAEEAKNVKRAEKKLKKNKVKEKYIPPKAVLTEITVNETLTVKELAEALKKTAAEVIKKLFLMGIKATQNEVIDYETAAIIGDEFGVKVNKAQVVSYEDILFDESEDSEEELQPRPPVVVVMGHVDHGKTSLLDAIRSTNTAEQEAGGITQAIGAYTVNLHGRDITFLDTPGHEAFTAMRARGAQVTDIAILVVAADDGVMPQTIEAINHAKAAGVAIIVAINKIDKPDANPERVKQELAEHGLLIEEWGGDVIAVPVSAKKKENIDLLLEMVLLTADILELKANPNKQAKGTVIEAKLDKKRGPVATLLVQRGTLRIGDAILTGSTFGHVRSMINDKGKKIKEAGPSMPVEIFGLSEVPEAGDVFYVVTDEKAAKQLAEKRKEEQHQKQIGRAKISLEDLFNQIQQGNVKELNLIIKADVQGSVEALRSSMEKLSNDEVRVKVIHGAVGSVIEADVTLAQVSNAIIIGFNVRPSAQVMDMAKEAGVDIRLYRVIYDAIEDIEKAMKGMLDPIYKEVVDGHAEVRQLFKISGVGTVGGCYVTDGKIIRSSDVRIIRNGIVIYEGKLASLKRFKDDVREVSAGYECGLMIERFNDIKEGDVIESFHMEEIKRD